MKKLVALMLAIALCASLAAIPAAMADETIKITIFVDGTIPDQANGRDEFEARWEELHPGFDLDIIQPDHSSYAQNLQQRLADKSNWPDVVIMPNTYYVDYAANGALWDMTDAWENSQTKNSGRFTGEKVFEGLKVNGRLYGFSPTRGNGCVTYVKKAWMDDCGITEVPTTYDAYIEMLKAFKEKKGVPAVAASGFIGSEAPYVNYLPEFYQDAYPTFVQLEDGTWVDGFTQDSMKAALQRIQDAVKDGLIDKETLTYSTKDCREKFSDDSFGVFTYWAGTWATNLKGLLEGKEKDGELIAMKPLEGLPLYFDRVPPVWSITKECKEPQKVFDAFIDTMLDGGDTQMLFTYGPEEYYWSTKAETVLAGTDKEQTYEDGQFHMLENREKAGSMYTKYHIDPMLALASFADGYYDPREESVKPEAKAAAELFNENSRMASLIPNTDVLSELNGDLTTLKNEIIADIALGSITIEQGYQRFVDEGGQEMSDEIVASLNELNK